jgi:hypothetical protein
MGKKSHNIIYTQPKPGFLSVPTDVVVSRLDWFFPEQLLRDGKIEDWLSTMIVRLPWKELPIMKQRLHLRFRLIGLVPCHLISHILSV